MNGRMLIVLAAGLLLLLLGLYIFFNGVNTYLQGAASVNWPMVQGTLTSSILGNFTSCSENSCYKIYTPKVTYSYTVSGVSYLGKSISIGHTSVGNDLSYANSELNKYPAGSSVTVYYDPSSPATSVLEPGTDPNSMYMLLLSLFPLFMGAIVIVIAIKGWRSVKRLQAIPPQVPPSNKGI